MIKIQTDYNIAWQIQRQAEHSLGQKSRSWYQKAILKTRKILEDCIFSYANSSNPYLQFQPYSKLWKPQQSMVYSMMNLLLSNSGCSTSNIYIIYIYIIIIIIYFFFYSRRCILISDENKPGRCWKEFLQWTQRRYSNQIYSCNNYSILSTGPSYLVLLVFLIFKIRLECNESSRKLKLCYQFTYECRILSTISTDRLWLSLLLLVRFSY